MAFFTDQTGRQVSVPATPSRIVSLVPSQTELLYAIGLDKEVAGITKFCVHPQTWFHTKLRIGGTKTVAIEKVRSLQPDLIIANKEENVQEQVELLAREFPVWISDVNNLDTAFEMILSVGDLTRRQNEAEGLVNAIKQKFALLEPITFLHRACYLIWKEPYMTVGGDTFISHIMEKAGLKNAFGDRTRYPAVTVEEIKNSGCQLLLLSSEPYPFGPKHLNELQEQLPGVKVLLVDGEMFSWYGSRLLKAADYFVNLSATITQMARK